MLAGQREPATSLLCILRCAVFGVHSWTEPYESLNASLSSKIVAIVQNSEAFHKVKAFTYNLTLVSDWKTRAFHELIATMTSPATLNEKFIQIRDKIGPLPDGMSGLFSEH
jgi:hypothetical protein